MTDLPFTLDQLRILKAIASEGSFKKAAESLYISQPAVSLQVQNLERQLSVPIFDRENECEQQFDAALIAHKISPQPGDVQEAQRGGELIEGHSNV